MNLKNDRYQSLDKIYKLINNEGKKYGDFKKCELHIHTPESKCYRFFTKEDKLDTEDDLENTSQYAEMTLENVLSYGKQIGFLSDYDFNHILSNTADYNIEKNPKSLNGGRENMEMMPFLAKES